MRVTGLANYTSFTAGDLVITRDPTDVPAEQVEDLLAQAQAADFPLEVVPE
jgi:hypothetical protein